MRAFQRLRPQFHHEWTWRLFCVLQLAGLLGIVLLDASQRNWDLLPEFGRYSRFNWDLLDAWDLSSDRTYRYANWLLILLLFGPFTLIKALDWVVSVGREPLRVPELPAPTPVARGAAAPNRAAPRGGRTLNPTEILMAREEQRKRGGDS